VGKQLESLFTYREKVLLEALAKFAAAAGTGG